ncbi:dolichyl-diphosphooligosaccharide--protein glycotransferase NDAI_0C00930 [Naumovozyma dairenensis CBS 421]|uniref:Thioredoxin domain-containing protein n=1 Tax=Naumovozyma dairenensis (strain ATCC 10597 / BCRC 20456 / CBS 421 / NBRC 0211 / NRRL Y-12639) TaxID=1071378 RepID=G0W7J3_NAUDC|nr:hypothetical protein NDAI_0C00930 [Naumovozyma dairenensis CBS 421]CCD23754.1 hypothetical protein NDAI_0C00930 [Naumovozyma dairenensis CBS 421]
MQRYLYFLGFLLNSIQCVIGFANIEHVQKLKDQDNIIRITEENYQELSTGVHDFYNVLYITMSGANNQGQFCEMCGEFETTLRKVSHAMKNQVPDTNVLFFIADVNEVPSLVSDLQLTNVPHLVVYPPPFNETFKWSVAHFYQYELPPERAGDLLRFGNYIAKLLNVQLRLETEFDMNEFLMYFCGFMALFLFFKKIIFPKFNNKIKLAMIILSSLILLPSITGYKFTEMNGIPFIARDKDDNIMYFSGGTGWQFGIEIFSVSSMYIILGSLVIGLVYNPRWHKDSKKFQDLQSVVVACALFYMFSFFLSCYKIKSQDYPFTY